MSGVGHQRRVRTDRHDPVVGGDPVAVGILQRIGISSHTVGMYGSQILPRRPAGRTVDRRRSVGHRVRAALGLDGGQLLGGAASGVLHRVVDAGVFVAEQLQDPAVVRPVVGQGDEVDLALLLAAAYSASNSAAASPPAVSAGTADRQSLLQVPPTLPPVSSSRVESSLTRWTRRPRGGWRPRRERRVRGDGHGCCELSWTDRSRRLTCTFTRTAAGRRTSAERRVNSQRLVEGRWLAGSVPVLSTGGVDGPPSSSGLGHHPFKVAARVRIPLGVHINNHWSRGEVWSSRRPVKPEVAGSSPVGTAAPPLCESTAPARRTVE